MGGPRDLDRRALCARARPAPGRPDPPVPRTGRVRSAYRRGAAPVRVDGRSLPRLHGRDLRSGELVRKSDRPNRDRRPRHQQRGAPLPRPRQHAPRRFPRRAGRRRHRGPDRGDDPVGDPGGACRATAGAARGQARQGGAGAGGRGRLNRPGHNVDLARARAPHDREGRRAVHLPGPGRSANRGWTRGTRRGASRTCRSCSRGTCSRGTTCGSAAT